MKRTKRNPAARAYFRAFYDGNRLNFGLTALLTLLGIPVTLSVSWLLGELLDAASARSMEQLVRAVKIFVPIALFYVALDLGTHWVKSRFLCRAMGQSASGSTSTTRLPATLSRTALSLIFT